MSEKKASNRFSFDAFGKYMSAVATKDESVKTAVSTDFLKNLRAMGYPSKTEAEEVVKNFTGWTFSETAKVIPNVIGGFMADEGKAFTIPSPNKNTTAATISYVDKAEQTKTSKCSFGAHKGETITSTTKAHTEMKIKNNRNDFKGDAKYSK